MDGSPSTSTLNGHSGITLVLPSLRSLQAANAGKKPSPKVPKIPRPVKLKPLKEVLTKLIAQIKKKDDYAFFIHPVDPAQVSGYMDVIKNPMDLGTITARVAKGKYRSLDEFTTDFRLVTTNAKTFNPPGSIYYTEADRLEAWGLDHISRASAHVIEYETDWNIDIEQDEDASNVNIDDGVSTPRDLDGSMATGSRAPSMTPAPGLAPTHGQGKRGPRGPYKRHAPTTALSEGLDADGRMPGFKDGVGVFLPGSDWAELMIALKIKGKRYKTKKERLRFEKEGPPYHPDGSLDYAEMEDPFSVLNVFAPEPPARPQVASLYPPTSTSTSTLINTAGGSQLRVHVPMPVTIPPDRPSFTLSTLSNIPTQTPAIASASTSAPPAQPPKKRRHWTIVRNLPARSRGKDKEGDATVDDTKTASKVPRDAGPADYGTFATLLGELVASASPGASGAGTGDAEYMYGSDHRLFATIRSTVAHQGVKRKHEIKAEDPHTREEQDTDVWTDARAEEAWDYLRDVVYGGVDGYGYVRSLAEFVAPSVYLDAESTPLDGATPLGVPVARYVEDNLVDTVTRGRHGFLRDVFLSGTVSAHGSGVPTSPFHVRPAVPPSAARAVGHQEQLDMAALIRVPEELAMESVLEGGPGEGGDRGEIQCALAWSVEVFEQLARRRSKDEPWDLKVKEEAVDNANVMEKVDAMDVDVKLEPDGDARAKEDSEAEDPLLRRLRLNLLALAKRAPLDKIAGLPIELVPEHIRQIVPIAQ